MNSSHLLIRSGINRFARLALTAVLATALLSGLAPAPSAQAASRIDLVGPPGSHAFGKFMTLLPNGNIVVVDPDYDAGPVTGAGAVYLYNGASGVLISSLTGSSADDHVGSGGITALTNGNYVVASPDWDNGPATDAGAVTWGDGSTGVSGAVSAANSLVGSTTSDMIGSIYFSPYQNGIKALTNGNYVVASPYWDTIGAADAGAATWGDGSTGVSGVVSAYNSLVGSITGDGVGYGGVTGLPNGNYVVKSPVWDNGSATDAGAATWGSGTAGITGMVDAVNSLVGSTSGDKVGTVLTVLTNGNYVTLSPDWNHGSGAATWGDGSTGVRGVISDTNSLVGLTSGYGHGVGNSIITLTNGNYVVLSRAWNFDRGAVTWGNGATGVTGVVSAANSLVGSTSSGGIGDSVTAFTNGNYVALSPRWNNGAGAVTWGDGSTGVSGEVSTANSLVGSTSGDGVGSGGVTELPNGNYVVKSPGWDIGLATDAGAVTWVDGSTGVTGVVSAANSLVGSTSGDKVGTFITALTNGNYVVGNPRWKNGAGAVTWVDGTTGVTGVISAANSLVGSKSGDFVTGDGVGSRDIGANNGVTAISNGNYVVVSDRWNYGAGAVTWGDGTTGVTGVVSAANSLVGSPGYIDYLGRFITFLTNDNYVVVNPSWNNGKGAVTWVDGSTGLNGEMSTANSLVGSTVYCDAVGSGGVTALANGNYVVVSPNWKNGAGAVTWVDGSTGVTGVISAANGLVGSTSGDEVGSGGVGELPNGNFVVKSPSWVNGAIYDAGAITIYEIPPHSFWPTRGPITAVNSILGKVQGGGSSMYFRVNDVYNMLVVGRPAENIVSLINLSTRTNYHFVPLIQADVFIPSP